MTESVSLNRAPAGQLGGRWPATDTLLRWLALVALIGLLCAGLAASRIAPYTYDEVNLSSSLTGPQWLGGAHVLGTDNLGRDLLSRILYGIRTSLLVGLVAVLISGSIGVTVGLLAGYARGLTDDVLMRIVDLQLSIPPIVLVIFLAFLIGPGLTTTCLILGLVGWIPYARLVRGEVMVIREQPYMLSAQAIGCSPLRAALQHALPQVMSSVIVLGTLQFGAAILLEASVSFLGFGIQPPASSLGLLISEGKVHLTTSSWLVLFPAAVLFVLVMLTNLLGDELVVVLDPVHRHSGRRSKGPARAQLSVT